MRKISIITPSFNQGKFIKDAIKSVLAQNDPCFEHIIIDGGSTDDTVDILKSYPHLIWISEKDSGQSEAVNKGLAMATGEIIGEINADDYYLPGAFALVRKTMEVPGAKPVCLGACDFVNGDEVVMTWKREKVSLATALRFPLNPIPHPSLFLTKSIFQQIGGLDVSVRYGPDIVQFIKLAEITDYDIINETLAVSRQHEDAIQVKEWSRNFTAVLYHIARHGSFENFNDVFEKTYHSFGTSSNADLCIPLMRKYIARLWETLKGTKIAVFGAGGHSRWLEGIVNGLIGPDVIAVVDEDAGKKSPLWGQTPISPEDLDISTIEAVILSSDVYAEAMSQKCRKLYGTDIQLIDLYEGLPSGPYRK